jgi:hypothetical protein
LPKPIDPRDALQVSADVQAPDKPGDYLLAWDMVVEHSGWFSERGNPMAEIAVTVAGPPAAGRTAPGAEPANLPQQIVVYPAPPARSLLWGAAARIWRAHPLLGIGPDVFRHMYGPELGLRTWDDRVHTNSLYLELLVGSGVVGLAAFLLLIGLALGRAACVLARTEDIRRMTDDGRWTMPPSSIVYRLSSIVRTSNEFRQGSASASVQERRQLCWMALGCGVALLTFLIHGVLDMFLEYTATNLLLWLLIGALGSLAVSDGDPARSAYSG